MIRQAAADATAHQDPTIMAAASAAVHASDREAEQQQRLANPLQQGVDFTTDMAGGAFEHGMAMTAAVADAATSVAEGAVQHGKALKHTVAGGIGRAFDVDGKP
jgi:hypothetical protein